MIALNRNADKANSAQALLNPIGKLMVFDSESDYKSAATATVINGVIFGFMAELSEWFQSKKAVLPNRRETLSFILYVRRPG